MKRAGKKSSTPRGGKTYNRTPVATYYRSETSAQSPFRAKPPKPNRRKYLLGAADIVLIIILAAVLIYSLLLGAGPAVITSDQSYRSAGQYAQQIGPDFAGLANKNKITFKDSEVIGRIEKQFPEVSAASIELPFISEQPRVRLLISPPAFKLKSQGQVFIVDQEGSVVTDQANQPQFNKLLVVEDQSGFRATVGKPVLSSQAAAFISTVIQQSQRAKLPISTLTLPAIALELDLRTSDQPYFVKFYLGGNANLQTGQLLAARQKFAAAHITPSQYLDVRVQGKIFYK